MTRVKICGITTPEDAVVADELGAHAVGMIFASSPRRITAEQAKTIHAVLSPWVIRVGVFVDAALDEIASVLDKVPLDAVQLHGSETPEDAAAVRRRFGVRTIKAIRVRDQNSLRRLADYDVDAFLLDTYVAGQPGGTGKTFDWSLAVPLVERFRIILAGGLTVGNVAEAVSQVKPYAVDVSSGVERSPGRKDHQLVKEFMLEAQRAQVHSAATGR